jgi:glycosyltransferase involved in cell wall biosynthesis
MTSEAAPSEARPVRVILVDPSLFTGPYDAALTEGLLAAGVEPLWAVRPTRPGDVHEIEPRYVDAFFYKKVDTLQAAKPVRALAKGLAHALGLARLVLRVARSRPDVVHFQWAVVPVLDAMAMLAIRRFCPVILTVHDTTPFNGDAVGALQRVGLEAVMSLASRLIVHTRSGHDALVKQRILPKKLAVVPHGPLRLRVPAERKTTEADARFTFVLFGELKPYKGIDLLIEAVARLPPELRRQARFVVAGRPRMDLTPARARITELGLEKTVEIRAERLSDLAMAELFAAADSFVFPYRQVDASGVYHLVKSLGRWLIASRVGVFAEDLHDGRDGVLIPPNDEVALATALADAIVQRPVVSAPASVSASWDAIGAATRAVYCESAGLTRPAPRSHGAWSEAGSV